MTAVRAKMVEGGRVIVPAAFRRQMGVANGDTLLLELHGDELRIRPARSALRRLQAKLKPLGIAGGSVADELIADRRAEAARE
jgi:AbrB family looped-hinge helix DNA binding protein